MLVPINVINNITIPITTTVLPLLPTKLQSGRCHLLMIAMLHIQCYIDGVIVCYLILLYLLLFIQFIVLMIIFIQFIVFYFSFNLLY